MELTDELDGARKRISKALHLDALKGLSGGAARELPPRDWVIVYRTAQGLCCMYNGASVELREMLDVQI